MSARTEKKIRLLLSLSATAIALVNMYLMSGNDAAANTSAPPEKVITAFAVSVLILIVGVYQTVSVAMTPNARTETPPNRDVQ